MLQKTYKTLSIADLPDDFLNLVYQRLTSSADHSSFSLVCHHWLNIQNNNHESLWEYNSKCSLRKSSKISPESFSKILYKLLIRFKHLKRLSLSGLPEVDTDYVTSQSHLFGSKVQFLGLEYCNKTDKNLSSIFSLFPGLVSVSLTGTHISDKGLEVLAQCCVSLEKVNLRNCQWVTDKGLEVLANCCASLETVKLGTCAWITDKSLEVLAKCCASLEKVDLANCQQITDKGLKILVKSCASLRKMALVTCQQINDKSLEILASCCPSLEKINLRNCQGITDEGLEVLARYCGSLKKVKLRNCQGITDKGLKVLAKCCASLEEIDLGLCQGITDKGLEVVAKCCASLEKINLGSCPRVTDSGISFIIQNCSKLRSLDIMFCKSLTGVGFIGCSKTLTHVGASCMPKLTKEGIKAIVSGGGIQSLELSGNAVNTEALITISKGCPSLKTLWLGPCNEVQLEGWKAIGYYCKNLERLHVAGCSNLCDQGLKALCYGCNKLSYLFVDRLSDFGLELLQRERPDVYLRLCSYDSYSAVYC
ncbi:hypothetical protein MKW94_006187 [Papaver nudicaule]|uniref:F-box domain-containing protein n=1 Tax=Papaver nudicaule TaxID=74823 RepID=A0AA41SKF3_PAPNU|nr:hypothetical protein [Papaver nudicaule]